MEELRQVIQLMEQIEGAFCPWSYLDRMDYYQQGGCSEEAAYAYANSNYGISARYYPQYQMWISHLLNRLVDRGILTCAKESFELRIEYVPVDNLLCMISDEGIEGLEQAKLQRKQTIQSIMGEFGLELFECAAFEELENILTDDQYHTCWRCFHQFQYEYYDTEKEYTIVVIRGTDAAVFADCGILMEIDYFVMDFPGSCIIVYPTETGYSDGYIEFTYEINFLSWNLIPFLWLLYGKLKGNVTENPDRIVTA